MQGDILLQRNSIYMLNKSFVVKTSRNFRTVLSRKFHRVYFLCKTLIHHVIVFFLLIYNTADDLNTEILVMFNYKNQQNNSSQKYSIVLMFVIFTCYIKIVFVFD